MPRKVIAYNLENTALASLCEAGFDVERDILSSKTEADMTIITSLTPAYVQTSLTILIADSYVDGKINYGELTVESYSNLSRIKVNDIDNLEEGSFKGFSQGFDDIFIPLVYFESSSDDIIPLSLLADGRVVSFMKRSNENTLIVIPSVKNHESLGMVIDKIIKSLKKIQTPEVSKIETLPLKLQKLLDRKSENSLKLIESNKEIEKEIEENYPEYIFMNELTSKADDKVRKAVLLYLGKLGFASSEGESLTGPDQAKVFLDVQCSSSFTCVINSLALKLAKAKKQDRENTYRALLVVNHQKYLPVDNRSVPFTDVECEAAKHSDIAITSTADLIKAYENLRNGIIDKTFIISSLERSGYVDFSFPAERLIGKIEKVSKDNNCICRFYLDNRTIRKGMKIIIEDRDGVLRTSKITALAVGKVPMADAVEGEVTVTLDCPVATGWKLFSF